MIENNDKEHIDKLIKKLDSSNHLSKRDSAYLKRIMKVYNMPDLTNQEGHPVRLILEKITDNDFFKNFNHISILHVVSEWETFDLFNFPDEHVARRTSDSYFLEKTEDHENSFLLRPNTSVMWYYLFKSKLVKELFDKGSIEALSWGKVYRVDALDKTHHECFHQIDWLKVAEKSKETITQNTLRAVLLSIIKAIFGDDIKYRINNEHYPYTYDGLEVEVDYNGK